MSNDKMTPSLSKIQKQLAELPKQAYDVFVANTPKRSGNARRSTKLNGSIIEAKYAYAQRLDEGWSNQSPNGMSAPTDKFIQQQLKQIIRK
jgi:hypothetical protein